MNIRTFFDDFVKYLVPGILTTGLEVLILIFLLTRIHTHGAAYLVAVGVTFVLGTTIQYLVVHRFIFHDSNTEFKEGYVYFMVVALVGLALTLGLVVFFNYFLHMPPIRARVITAIIVGIWNFVANYFLSFEMHTIREKKKSRNRT